MIIGLTKTLFHGGKKYVREGSVWSCVFAYSTNSKLYVVCSKLVDNTL